MAISQSAAPSSWRLIGVLVVATAIGPFSMQVFLPALPVIQDSYGVSAATAQLAFSLSAFAIAVSMLFYGPISDRLGRRPAMLGGIVIYLVGSVLCVVAPTMTLLILGRIVQAAGGAAGMVLGRAVVRDLYDREQAAAAIAYITMAMVTAPMIAPALGGVLVDFLGWPYVFVASGLLGAVVLAFVVVELPETAPPAAGGGSDIRAMFASFSHLLRLPVFAAYAAQGAFSMSVFFTFLGAAPYVILKVLERPASEYGLLFILVSAAFMAGNFTAARMTRHIGLDRMIVAGSAGALFGTALLLFLVTLVTWSPLAIFLPMMVAAFCQGLSIPNNQAAMVSVDPDRAGAASGLGGFLQMGTAALAAQTIGSFQTGTPYPMAVGMTLCAILSLLAALTAAHLARGPHR